MTLVQWGLYFHATQVVDAAAQDAARALRAEAGDDAARAAAEDLLAPARASGLLHEPTIDHTIDACISAKFTASTRAALSASSLFLQSLSKLECRTRSSAISSSS